MTMDLLEFYTSHGTRAPTDANKMRDFERPLGAWGIQSYPMIAQDVEKNTDSFCGARCRTQSSYKLLDHVGSMFLIHRAQTDGVFWCPTFMKTNASRSFLANNILLSVHVYSKTQNMQECRNSMTYS